ncbi:VanZ family protein [Isobaculum melis]|uniref:Glycopeptide antibiotics resistance protein n=1 Tax=Isobaculum melis TaxID=142588 RepID=A0A1H9RLT6_9LACT|nr:VanZ family protein [Isobaculum melis]SER73617.1 Glycopeptide antibiotics resistance protein [Isobaculum melis]
MSAYTFPVEVGILLFPFLAAILMIPFVLIQYRKYGSFPFLKILIVYSFVFYLLCAYFMVILPLPEISEVAKMTTPYAETTPFHFVTVFLNQSGFQYNNLSTYLPALLSHSFTEPFFNMLLLLPLGVYLRYYFKRSFGQTVLICFAVSLFFELSQLTGLFFIYPRPYRLFDVNDLMTNTVGGMLGYYMAPLIQFILPSRAALDQRSYEKGSRVSFFRRFIAYLLDWSLISFLAILVQLLGKQQLIVTISEVKNQRTLLLYGCLIIIYFVLIPFLTKGRTLGKAIVKIRLVNREHQNCSLWGLIVRYGLLYGVVGLTSTGQCLLLETADFTVVESWEMFGLLACTVILLIFVLNALYAILTKRLFLYERISHTEHISTISVKEKIEP